MLDPALIIEESATVMPLGTIPSRSLVRSRRFGQLILSKLETNE
jgi:hypothetical protein